MTNLDSKTNWEDITENGGIDYLLQSKLYAELAKQSMKKYKESTVEDYSKER